MFSYATVFLANLIAVILTQSITFISPKQDDYKTMCTRGVLINDTVIINSIVNFTNVNDVENLTYAAFEIQERGKLETKKLFFQNLQVPCENSEHNSYKCRKVNENVVQFSFKLVALRRYTNAKVIGTLNVKSTKISKAIMDFPAIFETSDVKGIFSLNGHNYTTDDCRINTTSSNLLVQFACISEAKPCRIEMILNGSRHINASDYVQMKFTLDDEEFIHIHINYAACTLKQKIKYFNCVIRQGLNSLKEDDELSIIVGSVFSGAILISAIIFAIFWKIRKKWQAGECKPLTVHTTEADLPLLEEKKGLNISQLLIKNQANVNEKTTEGYTALYIASEYGRKDIVELLIQNQKHFN